LIHHENQIGVGNRRQPVRDHDGRASAGQPRELAQYRALGARIQRRGRLVEDDDARIFQQRARDGDPLPLAAGEPHATLAHARVIVLGQPFHELVELCRARGPYDVGAGGARSAVRDVVRDRFVEQHRVLRHDADRLADAAPGDVAQVLAVDPNLAAGRLVQAKQQLRERRLARAAAAHDGDRRAGRSAERHAVEHEPRRVIAEIDVVELDLARINDERACAGFVDVLSGCAAPGQDREHPFDVDHRTPG
jgi:hypothetical protein